MQKFKTSKNNRNTYVYCDALGRKIEIAPGMEGIDGKAVAADHITMLHADDDKMHNAVKKDSYHGLTRYEEKNDDEGETLNDKQTELSDYSAEPETVLFETLDAAERSGAFKAEWNALTDKQRELILKKLLNRTNVEIAKEESVTETAVRNRLKKIQKRFEKFL